MYIFLLHVLVCVCAPANSLGRIKTGPQLQVSKSAKIRNRYNQVPHLTKDTDGKKDTLTVIHHTREPRGQPFHSR